MDKRWEELDNPEVNAARSELLALDTAAIRPNPIWPEVGAVWTDEQWEARFAYERACSYKRQAQQEQDVLEKRAVIEQFAQMLKEHKARGEEIEQFVRDNDIPGFCGWDGIENWTDRDPVDVALQWAASNHDC